MSKWEELEKAAMAATQGDTKATGNGVHIRTRCVLTTHMEPPEQRQADARYYAAANPSAILELLAERDALKEQMREVAMLLLDNDRSGIKQWADGLILGESSGEWSVRTVVTDQQKEIDALKAELNRIKSLEPVAWKHKLYGHVQGNHDFLSASAKRNYTDNGQWEPLYTLEKP